ncbi:hypothetical protein BW723_06675 [Polaribacter reichenbachii]|uniref:Multidrug transporter n=1 Tax=Polaribacter reichenbachii TaxID=996801 RepID=A0A1B8U5Y3_9FLAO|nr:hypothetical protein [Polaribacter reichenbachii]APZ45997.1 hypothetical protein BW723_06675 [Polaribacter reichenbachii]AUC19859.1 hypothetical protein BTO17_14695 [Polaribacter reichenbachii]OBY67286.1 hypothetical protein LPB301_02815 [Polaribacter reichenbachii]
MKNLVVKLLAIITIVTSVSSCGSDDPIAVVPPVSDVIENLQNGILNGALTESATLEASTQYSLTGQFTVVEGASLTIPAGTRIIADAGGSEVYIAVLRGAQIFINGNPSNPVVMSSASGNPGDWGGLTLCGNATTSAGVDAVAEVGDFVYGGTVDNDSSGNINYLQIVGTGAQITTESQYNGVSFYAVGSGTVVNNVAVINGKDDGVEFFGGTVSVSNLYLENNDDDSIDWTEGWNGTVSNAYISHTVPGFSTVFEGDKVNGNPKFNNITAVSTVGGTALQFKLQSGGTITGLSLSGYDIDLDMKDGGATSNVVLEAGLEAVALTDPTEPDTIDEYFYTINGANVAPTVTKSDFPWVDSDLSFESSVLQGTISGTVTLDASISYMLNSAYIVPSDAKLVIPAGTKITARDGGTGVYIAVLKGGQIEIDGTAANPVVISSAAANPGDWGGLTICGDAPTSAGVDAVAEVGGFIYGGTTEDDDSGHVKYLVIKGTGAQINSESQYNGVSLYGVGNKTELENIAVINGADDGVEFFGGTATASNLYLKDNDDDSIDWTEEWNGSVTNAYITNTVPGFSTVFEGDKDNANPTFTNITAVSTVGGTALQFKKTSGGTITGLNLIGYDFDLDMKDGGALSNVMIDGAAADATLVSGETTKYTLNSGKASTAVDISTWTWINASL